MHWLHWLHATVLTARYCFAVHSDLRLGARALRQQHEPARERWPGRALGREPRGGELRGREPGWQGEHGPARVQTGARLPPSLLPVPQPGGLPTAASLRPVPAAQERRAHSGERADVCVVCVCAHSGQLACECARVSQCWCLCTRVGQQILCLYSFTSVIVCHLNVCFCMNFDWKTFDVNFILC